MGLDMYAFSVPADQPINVPSTDPDYEFDRNPEAEEIKYWRKNNALHGWMARLAEDRLGLSDWDFNCEPLQLTEGDLKNLAADIKAGKLKPTEGFFFGSLVYSKEAKKEDLEFVETALGLIESGKDIYYWSWW